MSLKVRKSRLYLSIEDCLVSHSYKSFINITLSSIARICPAEILTILLGTKADRSYGFQATNQQSSIIYGMPMAVTKTGLTDGILSLTNIRRHLAELH